MRRRRTQMFVEALFAVEDLTLSNTLTDAYDSRLGTYASQVDEADAAGPYAELGGNVGSIVGGIVGVRPCPQQLLEQQRAALEVAALLRQVRQGRVDLTEVLRVRIALEQALHQDAQTSPAPEMRFLEGGHAHGADGIQLVGIKQHLCFDCIWFVVVAKAMGAYTVNDILLLSF